MGAAEQTQVDRSSLREKIITTSLELATHYGEEALTMRAVAARLGTSATTLYQYFDSKAAILREIRLRGMRQLLEGARVALEHQDEREAMLGVSRRYLAFARENPWLYRLLHNEDLPEEVLDRDQVDDVRAVQAGVSEQAMALLGRFVENDREQLGEFVAAWWCMLHGLASLVIGGRLRPNHALLPVLDLEAFIDRYLDANILALLSRSGRYPT